MTTIKVGEHELPEEAVQYIAFLHNFISIAYQRLSKVLSTESANSLLYGISELAARNVGVSSDSASVRDDLRSFLRKLGMEIETVSIGERIVIHLKCPLASTIHPGMPETDAQICPISVLLLAAWRRSNKTARVRSMKLNQTGSEIEIA